MISALIALALVGQVPFKGDPQVYCQESSGRAVPLNITLSELDAAFRSKLGYNSVLFPKGKTAGQLEFRGGYENIETVTYVVGYGPGVVLKAMQTQQIVEEETRAGDAMCAWTWDFLFQQH